MGKCTWGARCKFAHDGEPDLWRRERESAWPSPPRDGETLPEADGVDGGENEPKEEPPSLWVDTAEKKRLVEKFRTAKTSVEYRDDDGKITKCRTDIDLRTTPSQTT